MACTSELCGREKWNASELFARKTKERVQTSALGHRARDETKEGVSKLIGGGVFPGMVAECRWRACKRNDITSHDLGHLARR